MKKSIIIIMIVFILFMLAVVINCNVFNEITEEETHEKGENEEDDLLPFELDNSGYNSLIINNVSLISNAVIDSNDKIHLFYVDKITGYLKYCANTNGIWEQSSIDTSCTFYEFGSISINNNNKIAFNYIKHNSHDDTESCSFPVNCIHRFAVMNNTGIESIFSLDSYASLKEYNLTIDNNNIIHYITQKYSGLIPNLKLYFYDTYYFSGEWLDETVDIVENKYCSQLSIISDKNNKQHMVYGIYDSDDYEAYKYASNENSVWEISEITGHYGQVQSNLIQSNSSDLHFAYPELFLISGNFTTHVKYLYKSSAWNCETVDILPSFVGGLNIASDNNNNIYLCYIDQDIQYPKVKFAKKNEGNWEISIIDYLNKYSNSEVEFKDTTILVDSNGKIHMTYYKFTEDNTGEIRYWTDNH